MANNDDRPVMLIAYTDRWRSPTSTRFYKFLRDHSKQFRVIPYVDTAHGVTVENVMNYYGLDKVDLVFDGFGGYVGVLKSNEFCKQNNIKLVRTVADVEVHSGKFGGGHHEHNAKVHFDALYFPVSPDCHPAIDRLKSYTEDLITQRDAKLICVPFGIDIDNWSPMPKSIDLLSLMMAEKQNMFHQNRLRMYNTVNAWGQRVDQDFAKLDTIYRKNEIVPDYLKHVYSDFRPRPLNVKIGTDFLDYQGDIRRSKLGLADTSRRNYMTNKYLEYGAAECSIIGEKPVGYDDLLNNDTMTVIDMNNIENELPHALDYSIFHEDGRKEAATKARKLRKIIKQSYTFEVIGDRFETEMMKLIR